MTRVSMSIEVEGLDVLMGAMRRLPKEANVALRDASQGIANDLADGIKRAAKGSDDQSRLVAGSVRARRDRIPVVVAGGSRRVATSTGRRVRVGDLFFGAEFGGQKRKSTQQFRPHKGTEGYFFWPTIRENTDEMLDAWATALNEVLEDLA